MFVTVGAAVTCAQMEFDYNPHPSMWIKLIGASEELIETLEDNQVHTSVIYVCSTADGHLISVHTHFPRFIFCSMLHVLNLLSD